MSNGSRHSPGPHGSGAELADLRGWRAFLHLARELRLARLARLVRPYRLQATIAVAAMILVTLGGLATPYLIKIAIDSGIAAGNGRVLWLAVAAIIAVNLATLLGGVAQTYLTSWVGSHVIDDLRRQLFGHLQKLSLDFFSRQRTGWIVSRLTNDIEALDQLVTDGVTSLVTNSFTFLGAIILLFVLDWRLALATLAVMPPLLVASLIFRSRSAHAYALVRNKIGDVSAHLQESISGMRTLIAFRCQKADYDLLREANAAYRDVNMRTVVQSGVYFPFVELVSAAAVVIVLWYGGSLISGKTLAIGVLVAFVGYLNSFFDPLQQLSQLYNTFQAAMAAVNKIYTILDTQPDLTDAADAHDLTAVRGDIALRNVTFSYRPGVPVVHDLSLEVPAGKTLALVGQTGAGKSTIVRLLARFYDPDEGSVTIDGHDLRQVTTPSLRRHLVVVPQETFLFSGSLLDNLRFGRPQASLEEVAAAARAVGIAEFIESLPDGYETMLQPRGSTLSSGQRQLLSFARALLADPRVLILDEATSSVDADSERRIEAALDELFRNRTAIIIAHRLSTVRYADEIAVLADGRLVERGSHAELLALDGLYARYQRAWQATGQSL